MIEGRAEVIYHSIKINKEKHYSGTVPNYAYCKAMCRGETKGCPHYVPANKLFRLCNHYKLVSKHARHILNFTKQDQETLEQRAREAGL